jgi:hypothetical protein
VGPGEPWERIPADPGMDFYLKIPAGKDPGNLRVHPCPVLGATSRRSTPVGGTVGEWGLERRGNRRRKKGFLSLRRWLRNHVREPLPRLLIRHLSRA